MPAPVQDLALARARLAAAAGLRATLAWQTLRMALRLAFAAALAIVAGGLIETGAVMTQALIAGLAALALAALAGVMADRQQAAAEAAVADDIRKDAREALATMPAGEVRTRPSGALVAGLQRYPEALAALVVGHRMSALMLGIGPLLATGFILAVSWQAALTLLVVSPVMIVFFVFVGGTIHARAARQEKAFGLLAAQFEDRVRTLPTILSGHGVDRERKKLQSRMRAYAKSTMGVLKVAFLNAGIIDFFSSLSIAMLAVFLGLGHLRLIHIPGFSELQLWQSLFILLMAPEFFAPFRRYAEQYHAKAEGNAAAVALDGLLARAAGAPSNPPLRLPLGTGAQLPEKGLVAIVGPSGTGKSTLLRRLAGIEPGGPAFDGDAPRQGGVDWIDTDVLVAPGTLATALAWYRGRPSRKRLLLAAGRVGLLDDRALPGGLDAPVASGGENLSGGQRLRIGVARALLSNRAIFADEPTAKLDAANADRVRSALLECGRDRLVVVATHDPRLAGHARVTFDLGKGQAEIREGTT